MVRVRPGRVGLGRAVALVVVGLAVVAGPAVVGASLPHRPAVGHGSLTASWQRDWIGADVGRHVDPMGPAEVQIPPPRWLVGRRLHAPLTARINGLSSWRVDPYQE